MTPLGHKSPDIIATEVVMMRATTPAGFLLVEGATDLTFWRSRVEPDRSELIDAEGKNNLLGAVTILDREHFAGVLGVVDDDRDSLDGRRPTSPNVAVTDTADLECLLLRSPAWHRLLAEFGDPGKLKQFGASVGDPRDALLARGLVFGRLRWWVQREGRSVPADAFGPHRFIDASTWTVREEALYDSVAAALVLPSATLRAGVAALPPVDPWLVCRGHDLIDLLFLGLQYVLGPAHGMKKPPLKALMQVLRSGFDDASLHATQMWADMCAWEDRNPAYRMLRR